jgi:hypothetical protein
LQFQCSYCWGTSPQHWVGDVTLIGSYHSHYELLIQSRSCICVLIGRSSSGLFACMPDFQAGCHLSCLNDLFFNQERLISALNNPVDGTTVAYALKTLSNTLVFE